MLSGLRAASLIVQVKEYRLQLSVRVFEVLEGPAIPCLGDLHQSGNPRVSKVRTEVG